MLTDEEILQEFIETHYGTEEIALMTDSEREKIRQSDAFLEYKDLRDLELFFEDAVKTYYHVGIWYEDEKKILPVSSSEGLLHATTYFDASERLNHEQARTRMYKFREEYPTLTFVLIERQYSLR